MRYYRGSHKGALRTRRGSLEQFLSGIERVHFEGFVLRRAGRFSLGFRVL